MKLEVRRVWPGPTDAQILDAEEDTFRRWAHDFDQYAVDESTNAAVLIARDDDGILMGAWNRNALRPLLERMGYDEEWRELRAVILNAAEHLEHYEPETEAQPPDA